MQYTHWGDFHYWYEEQARSKALPVDTKIGEFEHRLKEFGLFVTVSSAFNLDEDKDDQELFDDFQDDSELEDSKL